ncbi:unnamed protein product [Cyclocybe aegerita]|uniref:Uncharacterized protein n=1 Tax=Cyclocybe aegerita TaxID=1973307 RepID=A0A8S0VSF4_CYCAE|nr:unnamed protein product [Cyclocybe aegerita]
MDGTPSELHDDEVIADSEDEMEGVSRPTGDAIPGYDPTSSVSAFTMTSLAPGAKAISSISEFTAELSHTNFNNRPKQAPRNNTDTSTSTAFTTPQYDDLGPTGTIADRAKTRQRTQSKSKGVFCDVIELTSDEDDELGLKPSTSKKAKMSPKVKTKTTSKPKAKEKETPVTSKAATISDSTTDRPPNVRPRPRPRPIVKRPKTTHNNDIADPGAVFAYPFARNRPPSGPPSSTPSSHTGPEVPIATSPSVMPPPHYVGKPPQVTISQLPPSDPPGSSHPTRFGDEEDFGGYGEHDRNSNRDLPRIETLEPGRGSSPDSMFDENAEELRQMRQSGQRTSQEGVDEPQTSSSNGLGRRMTYQQIPETMMPPTFFAGSSSSSIGVAPGPEHEVVDLTMFPTLDPTAAQPKASKPKKSKKKKDTEFIDVDMDPDAFAMPLPILDEDEADEDFDPSGEGSGKKKAKSKAKPKPKKAKGKEGQKVVEVVITSKKTKDKKSDAQKTSSSTGADKGPSKATATKGKGKLQDKDTFKSREFIEDSDEDADPLRLTNDNAFIGAGHDQPAVEERRPELQPQSTKSSSSSAPSSSRSVTGTAQETKTKKKGNKKGDQGSAPSDPVLEPPGTTSNVASSSAGLSSSSRSALDRTKTASSSSPKDQLDTEMPKAKGKTTSKKRKSIVDSEVDDEFRDEAQDEEEAVGKKKQKKGKNVVLSDEDDIVEVEVQKVKSKSKLKGKGKEKQKETSKESVKERSTSNNFKKASKVAISEEEDAHLDDEGDSLIEPPHEERRPTPEESEKEKRKATKENVSPAVPVASSRVSATPRPSSSTSIKPNPDGSTPLYARYEIAPRRSGPSMSELIRRANSMPGSPFPTPSASSPFVRKNSNASSAHPGTPTATTYSPYMKSSRRLLSRIAPLHPNRKTPPPPPPPPPPRKKTKKEIEMEEKWEEELVDSVGGLEVWAAMEEGERKEIRRIKFERERGGWDD